VGADVALVTGLTSDAVWGVAPNLGWRSASRSVLAPSIRLAFLRAADTVFVASGGTASFTWTVGQADACIVSWPPGPARSKRADPNENEGPARSVRLLGGVRFEGGVLEGVGSNIVGATRSTRAWAALGPVARAEWEVLAPLFLAVDGALLFRLNADRFKFLPDATIRQIPVAGAEAEAGLGVHFL
jgi:hypothetical protein